MRIEMECIRAYTPESKDVASQYSDIIEAAARIANFVRTRGGTFKSRADSRY